MEMKEYMFQLVDGTVVRVVAPSYAEAAKKVREMLHS